MRVEQRPADSTGGIAPLYDGCMRNSTLLTFSLFMAPLVACGEDAPTRPEDGTVQLWDACVWDGQLIYELCEPELACAWNGICVPRCDAIDTCMFDGFQSECGISEEQDVCRVRCDDNRECPQTGGAPLHCIDFFCVRDP